MKSTLSISNISWLAHSPLQYTLGTLATETVGEVVPVTAEELATGEPLSEAFVGKAGLQGGGAPSQGEFAAYKKREYFETSRAYEKNVQRIAAQKIIPKKKKVPITVVQYINESILKNQPHEFIGNGQKRNENFWGRNTHVTNKEGPLVLTKTIKQYYLKNINVHESLRRRTEEEARELPQNLLDQS
jgi:hypothetical protein